MEKIQLKEVELFCFVCFKCGEVSYIEGKSEIEIQIIGEVECDFCGEKYNI